MQQFKLLIISFCCIFLMNVLVQCAAEHQKQKDTINESTTAAATITTTTTRKTTAIPSTTTTQSPIYKIKRIDIKDNHIDKQKQHQFRGLQQQLKQQQQQIHDVNYTNKPSKMKKLKNTTKNSHGKNKKLLNKLGFTKVKAPNSHNRKRLAVESRRHVSPDDSHMFIIKLPPNFYYYSNPKAAAEQNAKNSLIPHQHHQHHHQQQQQQQEQEQQQKIRDETKVFNDNGKKVSFPFNANGKPKRIYHWNLPVIKKILEDKQRFPNVATATKDQLIDIKSIPTWSKPWENETVEKSYGKSHMMSNYKKSFKRKSPSYYAPVNAVNKNSFNKYFSGNGKPKGFYVIKENHRKPLYYKNII